MEQPPFSTGSENTELDAGNKRKRNIENNKGDQAGGETYVTAKPVNEARGHTGYLTSARRIVRESGDLKAVELELDSQAAEESQE